MSLVPTPTRAETPLSRLVGTPSTSSRPRLSATRCRAGVSELNVRAVDATAFRARSTLLPIKSINALGAILAVLAVQHSAL